jgi:hypothetical protein
MRKLITTLVLAACVTGTGATVRTASPQKHYGPRSGVTASHGFHRTGATRVTLATRGYYPAHTTKHY